MSHDLEVLIFGVAIGIFSMAFKPKPRRKPVVHVNMTAGAVTNEGEEGMVNVSMLTAQSVTFHIAPTGAKGEKEDAPVAEIAWATKDPALLTLTEATDGLSCAAVSGATAGTTEVSVTITNPDGTTATDTASVAISARDITQVGLSADAPVDV